MTYDPFNSAVAVAAGLSADETLVLSLYLVYSPDKGSVERLRIESDDTLPEYVSICSSRSGRLRGLEHEQAV
jgi:hypothetical protein